MTALANPRHERFCRVWQKTGNATRSYAVAYQRPRDGTAMVNGHRLLRQTKVQQRIKDMGNEVARKHNVTVDSLVRDLEDAETFAKSLENPAALVAALKAKALITGNIITKSETGKPGDFSALGSLAEVLDAVRKELGDDAADVMQRLLDRREASQAFDDAGETQGEA